MASVPPEKKRSDSGGGEEGGRWGEGGWGHEGQDEGQTPGPGSCFRYVLLSHSLNPDSPECFFCLT